MKSLLSLGLLGSTLAGTPNIISDDNRGPVIVSNANVGTASITYAGPGLFDIVIIPKHDYDDLKNTYIANRNVKFDAEFNFIPGIPGIHSVEIYKTTCAASVEIAGSRKDFSNNELKHITILDWSDPNLHDQYHPVGAKHSCDENGECKPCRVGTSEVCEVGGESPSTYPICVKLVNVDTEDGDKRIKNYGNFKANMTLSIQQGAYEPGDFQSDNDTILSQSWSLDASTVHIERTGSNTGIDTEQISNTAKNKWITVGETHSTITSSFSNTFKVKNAHLQDTTFISGNFPNQVANMSASPQYHKWASTNSTHTSLISTISETAADRTVDSSTNDLTITYSGDIDFKVPYPHLKKSYIESSGCSNGDCAGKLTIAGASSSYDSAVVSTTGWNQDRYECQQIDVGDFKRTLGSNPFDFDIDGDVMLSALFDSTKFPTNIQCDLDDTLIFNPPSNVTKCVYSSEQLANKTKGTQNSWLQDAFDACVVTEPSAPSAPTDSTLSSSDIILQTTGTATDADTSDTFYFSPQRHGWAISTAPETGSNKLHLAYTVSDYAKSQVEFACPAGDGAFNAVLQIDGAEVSGSSAPVVTGLDTPGCYGADTNGLTLTKAHINHVPNQATSTAYSGFSPGTCKDITLTVNQTITTSQLSAWSAVNVAQSGDDGSDSLSASFTLDAEIPSAARHHKATFNASFDDSAIGTTDSAVSPGKISLEINDTLPIIKAAVQYPTKNTTGGDLASLPDAIVTFVTPTGMDTEVAKSEVKCGADKLSGLWTADPDFPCSNETLNRTYDVYKRHKPADVAMTVALANGALSVDETDVYASSGTDNAHQYKFVGAVKLCSTAIDRDSDSSKITDLKVTVGAPEGSTYVLDNPQADGDCFKYDLTATGERTDLVNGNETDTLSFTGKYTYHTNAAACISGIPTAKTETISGTVDVKYTKQVDKFGGRIIVTDITNNKTTTYDEQSDHVEDITMQYSLALGGLTPAQRNPEIKIDLISERPTPGEPMTIIYDKSELAKQGGDNNCDGNICRHSAHQYVLDATFNVLTAYDVSDGKDNSKDKPLNSIFRTFTFTVVGFGDTERKVNLQVKIAKDASVPYIKTEPGILEFKSKVAYSKKDVWSSDLVGGSRYDYIEFDMRNKLDGVGHLANETILFAPDTSCEHEGVASTQDKTTLSTSKNLQKFYQTADCVSHGKIAFEYQGTCHKIDFECKRQAEVTVSHLDVNLNYGTTFTIGDGFKVVSIENGGVMTLGSTCSSDGKVDKIESDALCTKNLTSTTDPVIFYGGLSGMLESFQKCHDTFDDTTVENTLVWEMSAVRQYTQGSQVFCHKKTLELSVLTEGESTATIAVQSMGDINFVFWTDKFYFGDAGAGCSGTERKLHLVIKGTSKVGVNPTLKDFTTTSINVANSNIDDSVLGSLGFTVGDTPTGDILSLETQCQDFCKNEVRTINFDFVAQTTHNTQKLFADVSGIVSIGGNPCDNDRVVHNELGATLRVAKPDLKDDTCDVSQDYTGGAGISVLSDHALCYELTPSETKYSLNYLSSTVSKSADGTSFGAPVTANLTDGSGNTLDANTVYKYFKLGDIQPFADHTLKLTIHWKYDIGQSSRRLRTTYLLGSSDQESHASIQILPAGVQIQEQIEAGVEAAPAHDVIYNKTFTAEDVADHQHTNANWGLGLGIGGSVVGVGFIAVWIYTGWKRTQNGGTFLGGGSGYQKVGRFETNMAF